MSDSRFYYQPLARAILRGYAVLGFIACVSLAAGGITISLRLLAGAAGFVYLCIFWYIGGRGVRLLGGGIYVAQTGQSYQYAGDDPINGTDPTGLCSINPVSSSSCVGDAVDAVGGAIAEAAPYVAPVVDVVAGAACIAVSAGTCACVIAGNFVAQQLLVADQAVYTPNYDAGPNEAAIFAGTGRFSRCRGSGELPGGRCSWVAFGPRIDQ